PGGDWHAPTALTDAQSAVDWVRDHAATYRVNRLKVGVLGASAGGNLAMMLGTTGQPGGDRVSAVVSWSGQSDLPLLDTHHTVYAATNYLGCSYKVCPQRWTENSPIDHVDKLTAPMLLCNSTHELMPLNQATTMAKKLAAAKIPYELDIIKGDQHARAYATTAWPKTVAFLKAHLQ
ncbi:MAG TPA: prolyl oligopeptidase family serine peptidase, partial [Thermomicrobiaceae bacterium]|nr:prolyl oligopeptidase family serine peptidase [Thermomicrobiaceae bacterium]